MSTNMLEALAKVGLANETDIEKNKRREEKKVLKKICNMASSSAPDTEDLHLCRSVAEFRDAARKRLLENPDSIKLLTDIAHEFKDEPSGKELVAIMPALRSKLATTPR